MAANSRVVIDTNVWVSNFIGGRSSELAHLILDNGPDALTSKELVDELTEVLGRKKFGKYLTLPVSDYLSIHLDLTKRVGDDGQTVSDSNNYKRSQKLLREIEQRHQLTPMQEQGQRAKTDHLPESDRQRIEMRDQVRQALSESKEGLTFREKLGSHGIEAIINRDKDGFARGITFERTVQDEQGNEKRIAFKGSKLHQSLSVIKVQEQLIKNSGISQRLPPMSTDMKNAQSTRLKRKLRRTKKRRKDGAIVCSAEYQ